MLIEVKGLDAEAIANDIELAFALIPNCEGKHATESLEAGDAPGAVGFKDYLGVAMRAEAVTEGFEFSAEFVEVVDLAVEDNHGMSVFGANGLVA